MTLKLVNAFLKQHRKELGLKGYSKMSYLEKLNYLKEKTKGTKYEREIGKFTKPRVDEGIKKVLEKSGRGQNVRVKREKKARPPKPEPKGKVKKEVAKLEDEVKKTYKIKINSRITRYSPSFNINRKNSKLTKFLLNEGFTFDSKDGRRVYYQVKMSKKEATDFVSALKKFFGKDNPDLSGIDFYEEGKAYQGLVDRFEDADEGF
jgi:hypothetical protein